MNNLLRQLEKVLTRLTLSTKENSFIKDSLLSYMEMKPIRENVRPRVSRAASPFVPKLSSAVSVALITVVVLTGVAFAAEGTLPGDTLYSVKVNVTEKVRTIVAIGGEANANVEAKLAERRLQEAEKLAVRGDLDEEKVDELTERFKKHTEKVNDHIKIIEATNNSEVVEEVSSDVETALQAHSKIIESLSITASDEVREGLKALSDIVKEELVQISEPGKQIEQIAQENEELAKKLVINKQASARARIEEAYTLLGEDRELFSEKTLVQVDAQITVAAQLLEKGELQNSENLFSEAFKSFKESQAIAGEIIVVLETVKDLNIEIEAGGGTATTTNATSTPGIEINIEINISTSTPQQSSGTTTATSTTLQTENDNEQTGI